MTATSIPTTTPTSPRTRTRVAVIGGGASGVLTAINLLVRSDDPGLEVVVHEARVAFELSRALLEELG